MANMIWYDWTILLSVFILSYLILGLTYSILIPFIVILYPMDKGNKKAVKKKVAKFIVDFSKELGAGQYGRVYEATNTENQ